MNQTLAGAVEYTDPPRNECPGYNTKQFDGEVPAMLGLKGMGSTLSLPLLPSPVWLGVVAPDRALSIFTNLSARAGYDTRSIFKRSFTGLNSEFSFV